MLSFAAPAAFWLLLGLLPIVVLHLLRRRFRNRPSGSNWIWARVATSAPGAAKPELKARLILALQIGALVALCLAAAAPSWVERRVARPGLVVLVDCSASMASEDLRDDRRGIRTRVDAAAAILRDELGRLPSGTPAALFACGGELRVVAEATTELGQVVARSRTLAATDGAFGEERVAASLAAWLAARSEGWETLVLSDGGLELGGAALASAAGGAIRFVTIGKSGGGAGLSSLRLDSEGGRTRASFRAWNGKLAPIPVELVLEREGKTIATGSRTLAPGWSSGEMDFRDPASPTRLAQGPWDLVARQGGATIGLARLALYGRSPHRVLMVGVPDPRLLAAFDDPSLSLSSNADFPPEAELSTYDLVVANRLRAPANFPAPLLSLAAIPEGAPLLPGPIVAGALATSGSQLLNRFVSWEGSTVANSLGVTATGNAVVLAEVGGRAVAAAWTEGSLPRAFIGFQPSSSDFGLRPSWPLFVRNLLEWVAPRPAPELAFTFDAGEVVERALPASFSFRGVEAPRLVRDGRVTSIVAPKAGFFAWQGEGEGGYVAVNVPAEELDTTPRSLPSSGSGPERGSALTTRNRDLSVLPLSLLILCLVAEWLLWRGPPGFLARRTHARR